MFLSAYVMVHNFLTSLNVFFLDPFDLIGLLFLLHFTTLKTHHNHWKNIHFELVCSLLRNRPAVDLVWLVRRRRMCIAVDLPGKD